MPSWTNVSRLLIRWSIWGADSGPLLARHLFIPGYQTSVLYKGVGSTHAMTVRITAAGRGPCFVLQRLRRCPATFLALAAHFSMCVQKASLVPSQMPSQRIASPGSFSMPPWVIV